MPWIVRLPDGRDYRWSMSLAKQHFPLDKAA